MANIPHKYLFPFESLLLILAANFRLPQLQNFWQMELYGCKLHRLLYHFLHPLFQRNSSLIQHFPTYIYNFPLFALNSLHYKIYYLCRVVSKHFNTITGQIIAVYPVHFNIFSKTATFWHLATSKY